MSPARRSALVAVAFVLCAAACGDDSGRGSRTGTGATPAASSGSPGTGSPAGSPQPATVTAPAGAVLSDAWYDVRDDGRKNAWYHMVWTRAERDGRPVIHDRTEHVTSEVRSMAGVEDVFESRSVTDLDRTEDGLLLGTRTVTEIAGRIETTTVAHAGGRYVWVQEVGDLTERREVPAPEPLPVDAEAYLAPKVRAGELSEGATLTYSAPNYLAARLETVRLVVQAKETISTPAGSAECWRVLESVDGRPGETTWWLDGKGVLTRLRAGTVTVERTTEAKARTLDASAAAYEITFPADPEIVRVTSFDRHVVEATFEPREGVPLPDIPATPFCRELSREGNVIRLELTAHDDPAATVRIPVADPALAKHLEATNLYSPKHPRVVAALEAALRPLSRADRADGRVVARTLLRYVFSTLKKHSGPIPQPTAPEILEVRSGDCSEHAVLFVALCRAAGLPARRLSGYAEVGDMWGAHAFCEIWLGKWIGADPTTNELGTRARYVAFGWDEDPDSYPGLVSQRFKGRTRLRTVEFTDAGETVPLAARAESGPLRNVLSGISLAAPPEGWTAEADPHSATAEIEGPGVTVRVQVSAGVGDLDADLLRESQFGGGRPSRFCGQPAVRLGGGFFGRNTVTWAVPWRRRTILVITRIRKDLQEADVLPVVERILAPSFELPAAPPK